MSDQSIETIGNYMSYGPDGERVAAFATEADRTLFEAAPMMLDALKECVSELEGVGWGGAGYTDLAHAAIAAATGVPCNPELLSPAATADKATGQEQDRTACCPECATGSNLNETGTRCWNCSPEEGA